MIAPHDYHIHSRFSPDSESSPAEIAQRAAELGLAEIMLTEHQEYHPREGDLCRLRADEWFAEIARLNDEYRGRLVIRAGLEVGQPHHYAPEVAPLIAAYPFDAISGSLHYLGDENVFDRPCFDARPDGQAYREYFEELGRMTAAGGFDILAHPDVIKRGGFQHYGYYDIEPYADLVREAFRGLIANGIALEINTAALRWPVAELHPPLAALRWYREMGGELLTLGSDAHRPQSIAAGFGAALDAARAAGFTRLARFVRRRAEWVEL